MRTSFLSHFLFWLLLVPIGVCFSETFFSSDQQLSAAELVNLESLGLKVQEVSMRAMKTFDSAIVSTGMLKSSIEIFSPPEQEKSLISFGKNAVNIWWQMVYRGIWRFYALIQLLWWPLTVMVCAVTADGVAMRRRRLHLLQLGNTTLFYLGCHGIIIGFGMLGMLLVIPIPLAGWMIVTGCIVIPACVRMAIHGSVITV